MRRKFFLRRAAHFFLIMLVPMLLLVGACGYLLTRNVSRTLRSNNSQMVQAAQANIQLVINSVLSENIYISGATRTSLVLSRLATDSPLSYADAISLHNMRVMLSSITQSFDYIDSIYLYSDGSERIVSSEKDIVTLTSDSDWEWLTAYNALPPDVSTAVVARVRTLSGESTRLLTVFRRLLTRKGAVIVNIDAKALERMMGSIQSDEYASLYLCNTSGDLLAGSGTDKETIGAALTEQLHLAENGDIEPLLQQMNGKWVNLNGTHCLISVAALNEPGLHVLSAVSSRALWDALWQRLLPLLALLAVDLLLVLWLAYTTTKRSFDQIYSMLHMFEAAEQGAVVEKPATKVKDEYDAIMNNMLTLFLNTSYLNMQLKEKQYSQENAELMALQLQINPHFLYNTLQTLDMEARRADIGGHMSRIIQDVSEILKYSLSSPQQPVALREELSYLKKYVEVQRYRFGDNFIIYYEVEEELMGASVFRLMLQPVVENSLLHGIRGLQTRGYMKVRVHRAGQLLDLRVIDNGIGMTRQELLTLREHINDNQSRSIGLTNLNRRLILRYGESSALCIRSHKGLGTSVSFRIPFEALEKLPD